MSEWPERSQDKEDILVFFLGIKKEKRSAAIEEGAFASSQQ
jgi:hypothetical protein